MNNSLLNCVRYLSDQGVSPYSDQYAERMKQYLDADPEFVNDRETIAWIEKHAIGIKIGNAAGLFVGYWNVDAPLNILIPEIVETMKASVVEPSE